MAAGGRWGTIGISRALGEVSIAGGTVQLGAIITTGGADQEGARSRHGQ